MIIGIVLSQSPAYSETFFNSKIKGLKASGIEVVLFVQTRNSNFDACVLVVAPKTYSNKLRQGFSNIKVLISLVPYINRVIRFLNLERKSGRSLKQILKNIYTNSHLLKANLDWLHFGFATLALQSEHVAKAIDTKMAVSCRGYDMDVYPMNHPKCYNLLWKQVDKVHAISNYMKQKAHEHGMRSEVQTEIITPAIDLLKFKNKNKARNSDCIQITTVARLHWIKGIIETLEAMAILKAEKMSFQYNLIGSGPQYEELCFAIHQLGLTKEVKLLGKLDQNDVIQKLQQTNIYIQYSRSEGFCNAVLEAQTMGCLCIVSDGGALPENIIDGKTGWVVQKQNPKILAEKLIEVINLPEKIKTEIKNSAHKRIKNEFNIEKQINAFKNFYN